MRVAVFSDTHGLTSPMTEAVKRCRPDVLIHLGDHERDTGVLLSGFPEIPLYSDAYIDFHTSALQNYNPAQTGSWVIAVRSAFLSDYVAEEEAAEEENLGEESEDAFEEDEDI